MTTANAPNATVRSLATAIAVGATGAGLLRNGGFYTPDLVAVPLVLAVAAFVSLRRLTWPDAAFVGTLLLFAGGWLVRSHYDGQPARAASLSAAAVGMAAAYVLSRRCESAHERALVMRGLVMIALAVALLSLFLWAAHRAPWGLPYDGVWRLSGPFAYPNAAGAFFALAFVANVAQNDRSWFDRGGSAVVLFGALAATASRGALVALVAGLIVLGRDRFVARTAWGRRAVVLGAVAAIGVSIYVALLTFGVVGTTRANTASASVDDRVAELSAAARQGRERPLVGQGPEQDLFIHNFRGDAVARYAHNEVLQIWAGAGLMGVVSIGAVLTAAAGALRAKAGPRGRVARAAAVVLLVNGLLDFNWHFVVLVAYGGWLMGLDEDPPPIKGSRQRDLSLAGFARSAPKAFQQDQDAADQEDDSTC